MILEACGVLAAAFDRVFNREWEVPPGADRSAFAHAGSRSARRFYQTPRGCARRLRVVLTRRRDDEIIAARSGRIRAAVEPVVVDRSSYDRRDKRSMPPEAG